MAEGTLLAGAAFTLLTGAVFAYVGHRLTQRRVEPDERLAWSAFCAWWSTAAAITLLNGGLAVAAYGGFLGPDFFVAALSFTYTLACFALGSLLYYLLYVFTGRRAWWRPVVLGYAALALVILYMVRSHRPEGFLVERWAVLPDYGRPFEGLTLLLLFFLLVAPQIAAALAYLSLVFRVRDRTLRYRLGLVSVSLLVWLGSTLVASARGVSLTDTWQIASRSIGLLAALLTLASYYPPPMLRRRFGLASVDERLPDQAP